MVRSALMLSLAVLAVGCDSKSDRSSWWVARVGPLGDMAQDPVRSRIYVTDADGGRVLSLPVADTDPATSVFPLGTPLAGLAVDSDGRSLYVAQPELRSVAVLELPSGRRVTAIHLRRTPRALLWVGDDRFLATTGDGLVQVHVPTHAVETLDETVSIDALLAHDSARGVVFALQPTDAGQVVRCLDPTTGQTVAVGTEAYPGRALSMTLSFTGDELLVATDEGGVQRVDPATLASRGPLPRDPTQTAATWNPTTTRLYRARGMDIEATNRHDDSLDDRFFPDGEISPRGLLMAQDGQHLFVHRTDGSLSRNPLFDFSLSAAPTARLQETWTLTLRGVADAPFRLLVSTVPGYAFLDPANTPGRRFLDIEPTRALPLLNGRLDADGHRTLTFEVPASMALDGERFILQAVSSNPDTGSLSHISNPLVVRTADEAVRSL